MHTKHSLYVKQGRSGNKPRKIILCIDDAYYDPEFGDVYHFGVSNVMRFHNTVLRDDASQIIRYLCGRAPFENDATPVSVLGHVQVRDEAYILLASQYRAGDRIYLFGGGRGAAIAFSLAGLLGREGFPERINYTCTNTGRVLLLNPPSCPYKRPSTGVKTRPIHVEFLGLWDMVESIEIPASVSGHSDLRIPLVGTHDVPSNVKHAYHAVAIDDHRAVFAPALLNQKGGVEEVWFAGMHEAVIGGGRERLISDIPLSFMIERATQHGLAFHGDSLEDISKNADGLGVLSCESSGSGGMRRILREICVFEQGTKSGTLLPKVHSTVLERMEQKSAYRPPNFLSLEERFQVVGDDARSGAKIKSVSHKKGH